ncbi:tripartite tricarboxylate transporter TctB family protein [Ottowia testudinis]|uniref:Tripartite tricarboxylate transporter TctB family protein n=1 Tax=Ottowia testudinis TaxID=2816950 RepID=A0A975H433_9BURK|nr:tripartite tricarboxylate transporter TctB family protein [Ottowia testudinis]QTD46444.1 tripartite tricarboxylate transporter TctB family protein [Ottowia testudinis]
MRIKSQKDFFAGLLYMLIGIGFAWGATNYTIGDGARMGPGYFPLMLGIVLAVIGGIVMFRALVVETPDGDPIGRWAWKPLAFIIAANFLFGILLGGWPLLGIPAMGLIIAIVVLTFVAALAGTEFKFIEVLILAVLLAALSWFAFVWGLNLQFQVWPTFISG